MARFVYRMQNILNVKEKLETQAKNEFAIASRNLQIEEEKLEKLYLRMESYEAELKSLTEGDLDLKQIKETEDAIEVMKYHIRVQKVNVRKAEMELEAARIKLQEAMQERKTHDKLKEKQFDEFLAEEAKNENKEIDELVSYRHGQKDE